MIRSLTALPVFNEVNTVNAVLDEVKRYSDHILVVDDGSDDGTLDILKQRDDIYLTLHDGNRGYGAALATAFSLGRNFYLPKILANFVLHLR